MIYLDHNATTNIRPEIVNAFLELSQAGPLNASSIHRQGQRAKAILEKARKSLATLLALTKQERDYQITFTASGTEANNLLIANFRQQKIFISASEHDSIYAHRRYLPNLTIIKLKSNGLLDLVDLEAKLSSSPDNEKLVSVMLANNETGIIQPIKEITSLAHQYGALVHSDIVQAIGKIPVDLPATGLDFATISAHKFGGLVGAGALIAKSNINLTPLMFGGGQEKSLRPGTENILAIHSLAIAAKLISENLTARQEYLQNWRDQFEEKLTSSYPNLEIVGREVERLPNTSLIINPAKEAKTQLIALDIHGISVSTGAACSSGKTSPSHVLAAMGYAEEKINSALRISCGLDNQPEDIEEFMKIYGKINND